MTKSFSLFDVLPVFSYAERHEYEFDNNSKNIFPESDIPKNSFEGAVTTTIVNKYERSSIARKMCIEHYGCKCIVCGMDFEKVYGELGKGFIHVHHVVPLNEIGKEYKVDYKKDLVPVCPNCHAMLHRTLDGKTVTVNELRDFLSSTNISADPTKSA